MEILTYDQVTEHLKKVHRKKHLLLGNGFSMAYNPEIFSYNALSQLIDDSDDELLVKLFDTIDTRNFEQIMKQLDLSREIIHAFGGSEDILSKIDQTSKKLKESLITTVKELHPEHVFTIPEETCVTCAEFLRDYLDNDGKIFSTNYDILLYWVLMRNGITNAIDGFGKDVIEQDEWTPDEETLFTDLFWGNHKEEQNVFYLHGALPLFDNGIDIIKEVYDGNYILSNIKKRMDNGQYPLFVTAGNGSQKLSHIRHNHYLTYCYDSLCSIGGSLITFGFNFGEYDDHIIDAINKAANQEVEKKLWSIYIGVYSRDDISRIENIKDMFKCKKVHLFDSSTVKVWKN